MAGTFVFVHGTGVRREGLDELAAVVEQRLTRGRIKDLQLELATVYWAEHHGVEADLLDLVAPPTSTRALGGEPTDDEVLWDLLLSDPLIELAAWATEGGGAGIGNVVPVVSGPSSIEQISGDLGLPKDKLRAAVNAVFESEDYASASVALTDDDVGPFSSTLARAIVAMLMTSHSDSSWAVSITGEEAGDLVERLGRDMAPDGDRGLVSDARTKALRFLVGRGFQPIVGRRMSISRRGGAFVGDIARYVRRGEALTQIAEALAAATPPVVAVGHSLGGIMLVDLVSRGDVDIDLLVTVGSQSPALLLFDALEQIRLPASGTADLPVRLPDGFPQWLNIFDERDLLSFAASKVVSPVTDIQVDNGVGFPFSHSAYWRNGDVYDEIAKKMGA